MERTDVRCYAMSSAGSFFVRVMVGSLMTEMVRRVLALRFKIHSYSFPKLWLPNPTMVVFTTE
jgi:hypothetical protein